MYAHRLTHDIGKDIGLVLLFYKINASHFDVRLSDEHSNYRWVAKSDLPELKKSSVVIDEGIYTVLTKLLA